ncbi:MAG TPA: hypothetical protein PKC74_01020 [Turneriella sp.]|nr:hypothetical protein [Turneriella sp.]
MERTFLQHLRYGGIALLLLTTLHCAARQVRSEIELEEAARRAAANEEKGWQALERTIRPKDEDPDVEMQKKALREVGKIPSPRSEVLLTENLTNRYMRAEAAEGLMQQRNDSNRAQIDQAIINAARSNAQEFSGLTREEIRALGESDNPEAVRLLKQQIGRDPNKDEIVVESLGKILRRQKRSSYSPLDFTLPLGQAPATGAQLQFEDISANKDEAPPAAATAADNSEDTDPEKVLLEFLGTDSVAETKDKAVQSIADAHGGKVDYLLGLAAKSSLPAATRIAIIDYLTRYAVNNQDKSMIGRFMALKRRAASREVTASIDLSIRILGSAFGTKVATGGRTRRVVITDGYDPLPKEADIITLKQKPYPEYSAADVKTNLKKALRHYRMDAALAERMQKRVNELLNLPENRQSSERNLIFAALGRLYPQKDFYVLKEQGQDAFGKPGYFTTTLRLVTSSARGRSWQIAALQRVWGLTYAEADILRQIYLRDGKLLQQRMRL